ncbi:MAG: ORF6N domain-containing protein [Pseudomonadota bacterium]
MITNLIPTENIQQMIYLIREEKVMLDSDLAKLYDVQTKAINRAVKRNRKRFPSDFVFQLTNQEVAALRCHFGTSKFPNMLGVGGRRYLPYVFTEQGVAMLSGVLKSERAIAVNVAIMRAFVQLRKMIISHKDLARKLELMEKKYDVRFKVIFDALRKLMDTPCIKEKKKIGFEAKK